MRLAGIGCSDPVRVESLPDGAFASTIDYSDSANRLVIGSSDGQILLTRLNGNDPEPLVSVAYLDGYVQDLQFGPDGRYFASALMVPAENSVEKSGKDTASDSTADPTTGDTHPATDGGLTKPAGRAEGSVWDAEQLEKVGNLEGADGVSKLALVPGERALLTVGEDVQVWEFLTLEQASLVRNPSMAMQYPGVGSLVTVTALAIVTSAVLGAPGLLPEVLLAPFAPLIPAVACIRTAAISPDGQYIVTTTKGPVHNVMSVIERTSNKVIEKWTAEYSVCDMQFSRDGKYLLTATSSGVWIYETAGWKKERLVEGN